MVKDKAEKHAVYIVEDMQNRLAIVNKNMLVLKYQIRVDGLIEPTGDGMLVKVDELSRAHIDISLALINEINKRAELSIFCFDNDEKLAFSSHFGIHTTTAVKWSESDIKEVATKISGHASKINHDFMWGNRDIVLPLFGPNINDYLATVLKQISSTLLDDSGILDALNNCKDEPPF